MAYTQGIDILTLFNSSDSFAQKYLETVYGTDWVKESKPTEWRFMSSMGLHHVLGDSAQFV